MKSLRLLSAIAFASLALLNPAKAAVINVNEVIDLDDWATNGYNLFGTSSYTISDGDTVNINYSFANGRALKLTNTDGAATTYSPAWPWLWAMDTVGDFNILNASVALTDASFVGGSGSTSDFQSAHNSSSIHLGLYSSLSLDALTSVEFTGFTSNFTVDYLPDGTGTYASWLTNWGTSHLQHEVVDAAPSNVPDSGATLAFLGLGFAVLATVRRKA